MSIHWPETGVDTTGNASTLRLVFPFGAMNKPTSAGSVVGFWMRLDTRFPEKPTYQSLLARQGGLSGGNDAYIQVNSAGSIIWSDRIGAGLRGSGSVAGGIVSETTYLVMQIVTAARVHIVVAEPGQTPVFGTVANTTLYSGSPDGQGGMFEYLGNADSVNAIPFSGGEISDVFMLHGDFPEVGTDPDTTIISQIADGTLAIADIAGQMTGGDLRLHYPLRDRTDLSDVGPQNLVDLSLNQPQDFETGIVFTSRGPLRPEALMPDHIADCPAPLVFGTPGDISTASAPIFRVEGGTYSGITPTAIQARLIKEDGSDHIGWTTVDPAPSGGTWQEYDFTNVPATPGYLEVEFRAVDGGGSQIGDAVRSHGLRGTGFCVLNSQAQSQLEQLWETPSNAFTLPVGMRLTTSKVGSNNHVMMHSSGSVSTRGFRLGIGQMAREIHNQYPGYPIHIGTVAQGGSDIDEFLGTGPYQSRWGILGNRYGIQHPGHTLLLMGHSNSGGAGSATEYANNTLAVVSEHEAAMGTAGKVVLCPTPRYRGVTPGGGVATTLQKIRDGMWDVYQTDPTKFVWGGSFASVVTFDEGTATGSEPHPGSGLDGQGRSGSLMAFATLAAHGALPGPLQITAAADVGDGIELTLSEFAPALQNVAPVPLTAPSITGAVVPGRTVTITEGTYAGTEPITLTDTLTLNGTEVTGDMSGLDYTIPAGTVGQDLVYSETTSNGVAPDATQSVTETVSEWSPAELFTGGESGFAFDLIDLSGANTLSNQTGTAPGAGDPLGYLPGISPNAQVSTQSVLTDRPIVQVDANGQNYLAFDSTDILSTTQDMSNDTWTVWMVYEPDGGDFILMSNSEDTQPWLGIGQQGSSNTTLSPDPSGGIDSAQHWYDNTLFTGSTRGDSWTAGQGANLSISEAVINNNEVWVDVAIGDYNNTGNFSTPGGVYAWGAINRPLTSQERNELLAYAGRVRGV